MKLETLEKNTVTLFALIDKLEKVNYKFSVSDLEVAKKCSIHTLYSGALSIGYSERTREMIEKNYNQDVRNYVENPSEFMQYNMDLNINNITIYTIDYKSEGNEITTININDKTHIDNIIQDIESQNFEATVNVLNSICTTWVDLNNGYILGMVGEHQNKDYGIILKGKGEDVFTKTSINTDGYINKILPKGLIGYIDDIIKSSSTAN